jgi:hypothetical protein
MQTCAYREMCPYEAVLDVNTRYDLQSLQAERI